jgi:hypothetical protein
MLPPAAQGSVIAAFALLKKGPTMLCVSGRLPGLSERITRRDVLRVGGLGLWGLSLADLLRARAGAAAGRPKSVIMIWLRGGPSHIDSFDMKPLAPAEIRGEFRPISTNVPGLDLCEYLPRHAQMADKFSVLRGIRSNDLGDHTPHYIVTGFPERGKRPAMGSIVSALRPSPGGVPSYVSLMYKPPGLYDNESPAYTGPAHRPFVPKAEGLANLSLAKGVSLDRLRERSDLHGQFDRLAREVETSPAMAGIDAHTRRALEMISSPNVRDAFDVAQEPQSVHDRYGKYCASFLMARRLVEAGVGMVTLKVGDWDTHEHNFRDMKDQLPQLDQGFAALVNDLHERGLDRDVAVVMWGEFGRAPRITRIDGRDHWPEAGAAVIAGGEFRHGQVIGKTDSQGGQPLGTPYTPGNVLATLYRHLGIDPATVLYDFHGRPRHVLDDRAPVRELC